MFNRIALFLQRDGRCIAGDSETVSLNGREEMSFFLSAREGRKALGRGVERVSGRADGGCLGPVIPSLLPRAPGQTGRAGTRLVSPWEVVMGQGTRPEGSVRALPGSWHRRCGLCEPGEHGSPF